MDNPIIAFVEAAHASLALPVPPGGVGPVSSGTMDRLRVAAGRYTRQVVQRGYGQAALRECVTFALRPAQTALGEMHAQQLIGILDALQGLPGLRLPYQTTQGEAVEIYRYSGAAARHSLEG